MQTIDALSHTAKTSATARFVLGLALSWVGLPSFVLAQNGYAVQGPFAGSPATPPRNNIAYQQQRAPAAGSGLGSQPQYYAPQPQATTPRPRYTSPPAYAQRPIQQTPAYVSNYGPPYPYPAGTVQTPAYVAPTKKKTTAYQPVTNGYSDSNAAAQMANDISDLKGNDRTQDRRLAALESRLGTGKGTTNDDGYISHTVRFSDTLWRISDKYGTTPTQIRAANHMTSDVVLEGQTLIIPIKRKTAIPNNYVPPAPIKSGTHIVQPGESLSVIAASYGVSTAALQSANGIRNADSIQLHQRLIIPGRSTRSTKAAPIYTSKKSTPKKQAAPRYVSTPKPSATLQPETVAYTSNNDFTGSITPPQGPRGMISYRVEQGDTWETVARSFSTSAADIRSMNKMENNALPAAGSEIIVPSTGPESL